MSIWQNIKRGFGYGVGGRIGWETGGAIWRLLTNWRLLLVGAATAFSMSGNGTLGEFAQATKTGEKTQVTQPPPTPATVKKPVVEGAVKVEKQGRRERREPRDYGECVNMLRPHDECKKLDPNPPRHYNMATGAWE